VLFAVAAGTNVSTPLLLLYRDRLDLSGPATTSCSVSTPRAWRRPC
jgi:hypothetical protein